MKGTKSSYTVQMDALGGSSPESRRSGSRRAHAKKQILTGMNRARNSQ